MPLFPYILWLAVLFSYAPYAFAPPPGTAAVDVRTSSTLTDPTLSVLEGLRAFAGTPAERASVNLHQGDLERIMDPVRLTKMGMVNDLREAYLLRSGMAYSDFGKIGAFKEWLTKESGHKIGLEEYGVTNPSQELYAVLQGTKGAMWNESPLKERKAYFEPLMKMLGGPVINPNLSYQEIMKFAGATQTIPGTTIQIPKYPMFIGYMHEWQGVFKSYLDANLAIEKGQGPLAGVVRNLSDYSVILESIYGHNGSGPTREAFTKWFKTTNHREPQKHELPFWIQAHEIVIGDAQKEGVAIFNGSFQEKRYAGSERTSHQIKYSLFHRITDRVDGVIHPEKIYEEIAFLGPLNAVIESYFGGNYDGTVNLQKFTREVELEELVESGSLLRADAEILKLHINNQLYLAKKALVERTSRTIFYAGDSIVPPNEVALRANELTAIGIATDSGVVRFDVTKNEAGKEVLVDHSGKGQDFIPLFRSQVFQPAYRAVTQDPLWSGKPKDSSSRCFSLSLTP